MKKYFKMFGAVGLLAGMMMLAGCGDDATSPTATKSTTVTIASAATVAPITAGGATIPTGTVVATLPAAAATTATAPGVTGATNAVSIPASTQVVLYKLVSGALTLTSASGTSISLNVTTPTNGTTAGVPAVKVGATSFTVADSAGAADISFAGADAFKLTGTGATVNIPVVKAPDNTVTPQVIAVKADGTTITYPKAGSTTSYTAATATTSAFVTVNNVTDFCWYLVNPKKANTSGSGSVSIF